MMDLPEGARKSSEAGQEFRKQYRAFKKAIGANIRRYRKKRRMALKVLARRTGMSAERLDYWELGRMDIHLTGIIRIAAALKVPHSILLESPPGRTPASEPEETETDEPKDENPKTKWAGDLEGELDHAVKKRLKNPYGYPDHDALFAMEEPVYRIMRSSVLFCDLAFGAMKDGAPNPSGLVFLATSMRREAERIFQLFTGTHPKY